MDEPSGDTSLDKHLFAYLAVGLLEFARNRFNYPYPVIFQFALNKVALLMIARHRHNSRYPQYPPSVRQVLQLFQNSLKTWWPSDLPAGIDPDLPLLREPLLDESSLEEQVLNYLENLVDNASWPAGISLQETQALADQRWIRDLVLWTREDPDRRESEYVLIRRFLIEHPWMTDDLLRQELGQLVYFDRKRIGEVYESVDHFDQLARYQNSYWECPHCKGLLSWIDGQPRCAKNLVCGRLKDLRLARPVAPRADIRRLKWSIHTRVCVPGQIEIDLTRRLLQAGVDVLLWPGGDRYDLRVTLPGQRAWAVDVKDYESPFALANHISRNPFPRFEGNPSLHWERAFYVIPAYRTMLIPRYIQQLKRALLESHGENVEIMSDRQFFKLVKRSCADSKSFSGAGPSVRSMAYV
jgi:hypothetical protein